jgi:hypothetical protein
MILPKQVLKVTSLTAPHETVICDSDGMTGDHIDKSNTIFKINFYLPF